MVISLSYLWATSQYAKDKEKTFPAPPPPALSACFALVHQFLFIFFLSIIRMTMRLMFVFPYHTEWSCISPWVLARDIWLDKLILPKNKRCNKFAHVSFSVVDRRCPTPTIPANGRVRGKNSTFGSVIKYRCSSSYKLQGPKIRTCRGNGNWDGETPICS